MRTKFFFFAMLASVTASAQTSITIMPINADYASKTVRFSVSWLNSSRTGTHNSKVWVFVDYRTVTNNVPSGSWTRALISGTPTATSGTPTRETGNDKGFWLQGTSGSSGTYNATVTVKLSGVPAKFNWCAYVSDYPPNVTLDKGTYTFKGTTNFIMNSPAQTVTTKTIAKTNLTVNASTTFTDATGCPGIGNLYCPYTGSDLYMDLTHLCQQRTSGAKNWEAYIKDPRDNELYRIVQYSNGVWWWAEDYRGSYGYQVTCNGFRLYSATNKSSDCPTGWRLPLEAEVKSRFPAPGNSDSWGGPLTGRIEFYGSDHGCGNTTGVRCDIVVSNNTSSIYARCAINGELNILNNTPGTVRCLRQL
jgi:hypothetical protein